MDTNTRPKEQIFWGKKAREPVEGGGTGRLPGSQGSLVETVRCEQSWEGSEGFGERIMI